MKLLRRALPLALLLFVALDVRGESSQLPFTLNPGKSRWRIVPLDRELSSGLKLVAMIVGAGTESRAIVVTAPNNGGGAEETAAFASRVREYFNRAPALHLVESDETKIGYAGRRQRYELSGSDLTLACELFVFSTSFSRWAVLQWRNAKTAENEADSPIHVLQKAEVPPAGVVSLPAFKIKDHALSSFPVGLKVVENPLNGRISKIVVASIPPGSILEREEVSVGDEIVEIDGRKPQDFAGGSHKDGELGKIFLDRELGSEVDLVIVAAKSPRPVRVTLRNGSKPGTIRRPE